LNVKLNANIHCHITEDITSMTHQWQCPAGLCWKFSGIQEHY